MVGYYTLVLVRHPNTDPIHGMRLIFLIRADKIFFVMCTRILP
jgi:hypothetical protein